LKALASPIVTFGIFVGVLWFWHIPLIYEMAQESEPIHVFEHLTFMGAALIGWWPVLGVDSARIVKPEPPVRILYLFLLAIPCTGLAAILTFAKAPLYPFYVEAPHIFGLTALQDQHLGGLLMWLPTHMFILLLLGVTFYRWFAGGEYRLEVKNELLAKG
jgi:putative membrane protein